VIWWPDCQFVQQLQFQTQKQKGEIWLILEDITGLVVKEVYYTSSSLYGTRTNQIVFQPRVGVLAAKPNKDEAKELEAEMMAWITDLRNVLLGWTTTRTNLRKIGRAF